MAEQISQNALRMMARMHRDGRIRTDNNMDRLGCIELKGFGMAFEPHADVWELTARAVEMQRRGRT
jgi:hypothetical protein